MRMMAQLHDIPKYAFGTAFEIDPKSGNEQPGSTCAMLINRQQDSRITANKFEELIRRSISLGCRHFDCAPLYGTQQLVGCVLGESMRSGGASAIPRQQFFITSKLPPNMMSQENIVRSVTKSIQELQCNYLDLLLIHAPFSTKYISDDHIYPTDDDGNLLLDEQENVLEEAWRKLAQLKRDGFTRYIGISNVNMEQLERLNSIHHVDVVQNEYHIYNQNKDLFDHCEELDVHFEAYAAFGSPIKARRDGKPCFNTDPVVRRVARRNGITVSQANIQWIHRQPLSYVVRCDSVEQLEENFMAIERICLPLNDLIDLDSLNKNIRIYYFDEHKGLDKHREYPFRSLSTPIRDPPRHLASTVAVRTGPVNAYAIGPNGGGTEIGPHANFYQGHQWGSIESGMHNPERRTTSSSTSSIISPSTFAKPTSTYFRSASATGAWPRVVSDHSLNYYRQIDDNPQQPLKHSDEPSKQIDKDDGSSISAGQKETQKQRQHFNVSVKVFKSPLPYASMHVKGSRTPTPTTAPRHTTTPTPTSASFLGPSEAHNYSNNKTRNSGIK